MIPLVLMENEVDQFVMMVHTQSDQWESAQAKQVSVETSGERRDESDEK